MNRFTYIKVLSCALAVVAVFMDTVTVAGNKYNTVLTIAVISAAASIAGAAFT